MFTASYSRHFIDKALHIQSNFTPNLLAQQATLVTASTSTVPAILLPQ